MNSNTAVVVIMCAFFIAVFGGMALSDYEKGQIKIACYEAAKTNTSIKCQ